MDATLKASRSVPGTSRRRLLFAGVAGLGLAALPGLSGAAFADAPAGAPTKQPKTVGPAVILDGANNTRDLGGYTTADGAKVRYGKVFRSGALSGLTATGVGQLAALGVNWSIDLRTDVERYINGKDQLPAAVNPWLAPIGNDVEDSGGFPPPVLGVVSAGTLAEFSSYISSAESRIAVGSVLRMLALKDGAPLIFNCSSGSTRSGWTAAILLTALGVPRDQVNADFLRSNDALGGQYLFPDYLDAAFTAINDTYGDLATFLNFGLNADPDIVAALKAKLLKS